MRREKWRGFRERPDKGPLRLSAISASSVQTCFESGAERSPRPTGAHQFGTVARGFRLPC
jgi:hypothetical protein